MNVYSLRPLAVVRQAANTEVVYDAQSGAPKSIKIDKVTKVVAEKRVYEVHLASLSE